jgi:hypothetical protein
VLHECEHSRLLSQIPTLETRLTRGIQCGLSGTEGQFKMQDDLAVLFSRNLTFANSAQPSVNSRDSKMQAEAPPVQPVTYITQHYHHSAHAVPSTAALQSPIISPSTVDFDQTSPAAILAQHNIDPSALFPSQLTLFQHADPDQRLRLIQLWRISPPSYGGHALAQELGNWPPTSLKQEEEMGQIRYERSLSEQRKLQGQNRPNEMEQDCEGSMLGSQDRVGRPNAEPYMVSGYETLAQRDYNLQAHERQQLDVVIDHYPLQQSMDDRSHSQATDPVYRGQQWWQNFMGSQAMEDQYGAFDQLNRFQSQSSGVAGTQRQEDEEML